ncbi:MAG: putative signal transducing protein [Bacteroidota bacterium]
MPYCTKCGYEYLKDITRCPDCEEALKPGERVFCASCGEDVGEEAAFCQHCGVLSEWVDMDERPILCDLHRETEAVGCCVICRKSLCVECAITKAGRLYCVSDQNVKSAFNWVVACTTGTMYEAEMIKANLEGAGIATMVLSQNDSTYVTTLGDLSVTEVMVPGEHLDEAKRFLRAVEAEASEAENSPPK